MISLRQHIASLVAVFLALAVGIVLGGGPLADDDDPDDSSSSASPSATPSTGSDDQDDYADAFAAEGAPRLYANGLDGHASAILAMPGADTDQLKALSEQITAAGGSITGTYVAGDKLVDPAERDFVDTESGELTVQLGDPRVDPTAPTYERMGMLLAMAMATDQSVSERADLAAVSIREALAGDGLLTSPADVRNAPLILVVLPPGADGEQQSLATRTVLAGLVNGMATQAAGVVVVGDEDSAEDGDLAAVREAELVGPISTVDGMESTIGQVTAVLAMVSVLGGTGGSYGASGSDGPVPLQ